MSLVETLPEELRSLDTWIDDNGVQWFATGRLDVRDLARAMNHWSARFVTITALQLPRNEGLCLEYLWDLEGKLFGFPFYLEGNTIASIFDICEAADWIEREIHEGFAIDFTGHAYEPLLLREGDRIGVNLREEKK
jgi:NADH:ubiquinone oxidoreductase subunit C